MSREKFAAYHTRVQPCIFSESVIPYTYTHGKVGTAAVKIQKSSQDYLEAMLMMQQKHGYIRSIDVAEHLGVTKPSVSYATKRLRENGYLTMDKSGRITLSETGLAIAQKMYTRHTMLTEFLLRLGVSEETAKNDACRIEHDISDETFAAICRHALPDRISPKEDAVCEEATGK